MTTFSSLSATWESIKSPLENQTLKISEINEFVQKNIRLQSINSQAITVVDLRTRKYLFVDEKIERVTGYTHEEHTKNGPRFMFSKIPLAHKVGVIRSSWHQNKFISTLSKKEIDDIILNREINIINKEGVSQRILHQVLAHITDKSKKVQAVVSLQTQIGHLSSATKFKYYIFSRKQNEVIYPKADLSENDFFTPREKEIILLVSKGLSSNQIAAQLYISLHTVKTHRKNILKKSNSSNFFQLISSLDKYKIYP